MRYNIDGPGSFQAAMDSIRSRMNVKVKKCTAEVGQAVADVAVDCLRRSVQRAPIESGGLRESAKAEVNMQTIAQGTAEGGITGGPTAPTAKKIYEASVGYDTVYDMVQHEDVSLSHTRTDGYRRKDGTTVNMVAGGEAKYLESVVLENEARYAQRIANAAKNGLRGDGK